MNTILFVFIDIIAVQTDIPARQQKIYAVYSDLSGAFFESRWDFRKGHRFFIGVFRKLSNKFEPDILEQLLQDVRLFCFTEGRPKNGTVIKKGKHSGAVL